MSDTKTKVQKPKPRDVPAEGEYAEEDRSTREALEAQPKVTVYLMQRPKDSTDPPLPPVDVSVNGCVYRIERGVPTEVPMTIAEILNESGRGAEV